MDSSLRGPLQDDDVNFDEELAHRNQEKEAEAQEYRRLLEAARKGQNRNAVTERIAAMLVAAEDPIDESPENIEECVRYITGPRRAWSSERREPREFRRLVCEAFEAEWTAFATKHPAMTLGQAMQKMPPTYFALPLPAAQLSALAKANPSTLQPGSGVIKARLHYHDSEGNLCSMVREILFSQSAEAAVEEAVARIHVVLNIQGAAASEYCFKVVGRAEYIFGTEKIIDFRHIRDCVVKQQEIRLYVMRLPFDSSVLSAPRFNPSYAEVVHQRTPTHDTIRVGTLSAAVPSGGLSAAAAGAAAVSTTTNNPVPISVWDVTQRLTIQCLELGNINIPAERFRGESLREGDDAFICLVAEVVFGGRVLCAPQRTPWRCVKGVTSTTHHHVVWGPVAGSLTFDLRLSNLPREARVSLSVVVVAGDKQHLVADTRGAQLLEATDSGEEKKLSKILNLINQLAEKKEAEVGATPVCFIGWVNVQLFDHRASLRCGALDVRMWSSDTRANAIGVSSSNPDPFSIGLRLACPSFAKPVVVPSGNPPDHMQREFDISFSDAMMQLDLQLRDNKIAQLRQVKKVLATDPLYRLTATDTLLLWLYREDLTRRPKALCKFMLAVDWAQPAAVHEAHTLMDRWAPMQPMDALELLDARFADSRVRRRAVECLDRMRDNELRNCVLQLVQVLKYEPYHYSALARFLLKRALANPHMIGHSIFWHLKAEMYNPAVSERHGLLIEEFIQRLPARRDFVRQHNVVEMLLQAALRIKESKKNERIGDLREALDKINLPPSFSLALNPAMECSGLLVSKCKVMDSKKLPLWLVFKNADSLGAPIYVMFKAGDDLRQDLLTLQMLELMDTVWKSAGVDLHMIPYGCVATSEGVGMIEIVLSSDTCANITRKDGGAQAAFSEEPLMNWLRKYNRTPPEVERCLWNFVYSTAGYCVATYILGIGDRHNDNIMLREDGTLFHIDFGHFLGNFKTKFGIKRETAPFIFTPMYAHMMGGPASPIYDHFCEICCRSYNIIRRQTNLLMTLFMLMLSTGIPELRRVEDITWLKQVLLVNESDENAAKHFRQQIQLALDNWRTLWNDYIHMIAH